MKPAATKALLIAMMATIGFPEGTVAATPQQERDECARNLQTIYQAIQKYRRDKKDVPVWLSDLVPDYLEDPNVLVCPVTRRTGELKNKEYSDPRISTSYIYEFNDKSAPGGAGTNRQWKHLQMSVAGSIVPIVRCLNHDPVLNLSFDGKIYESKVVWEDQLKELIDPAELSPPRLFARYNPMESFGSFHPLDLTKFYNCKLTQPLHNPVTGRGPSLKNFPAGTNVFGGITFYTEGVIQLNGGGLQGQQPGRYTNVVTGIPVGLKVRRLHFLGGAGWNVNDQAEIGTIVVHYENRSQDRVPIIYNRQVKDWWQEAPSGGPDAPVVAWSGDIDKDQGGTGPGNVYRYFWVNPQPDVTVTSLDLRSTMLQPAPFIIAITAESK
jgi:type II secretory pathway pseudopilin PulG